MIELFSLIDPAAIVTLIGAAKPFVTEISDNSGERFKELVKDGKTIRR